jgi:hypothetical protein
MIDIAFVPLRLPTIASKNIRIIFHASPLFHIIMAR